MIFKKKFLKKAREKLKNIMHVKLIEKNLLGELKTI
jgi:hypothetical protein